MRIITWRQASLVALALGVLLAVSPASSVTAVEHRVYGGLQATVCVTAGWHDSGHPGWAALDMQNAGGNPCVANGGTNVYWRSEHLAGSQNMVAVPMSHVGACSGMDVVMWNASQGYLGDYTFTHVSVASWGSWTASDNWSWTVRYVGTVLSQEVSGCAPTWWTGPHLHQGGDVSSGTVLYTNGSLPVSYGDDWLPTQPQNWMHRYMW